MRRLAALRLAAKSFSSLQKNFAWRQKKFEPEAVWFNQSRPRPPKVCAKHLKICVNAKKVFRKRKKISAKPKKVFRKIENSFPLSRKKLTARPKKFSQIPNFKNLPCHLFQDLQIFNKKQSKKFSPKGVQEKKAPKKLFPSKRKKSQKRPKSPKNRPVDCLL
jgi:hypothetical protein